jgi:hypothetical protein
MTKKRRTFLEYFSACFRGKVVVSEVVKESAGLIPSRMRLFICKR